MSKIYKVKIYQTFPPHPPKAHGPPIFAVGPQRPSAAIFPDGPATTTGAVGGPRMAAPCPVAAIDPPPAVIAPTPPTPMAAGAARPQGAAAIAGVPIMAGPARPKAPIPRGPVDMAAALGAIRVAPNPQPRPDGAAEATATQAKADYKDEKLLLHFHRFLIPI